jgi:glucose/arabinose dehydrogenase
MGHERRHPDDSLMRRAGVAAFVLIAATCLASPARAQMTRRLVASGFNAPVAFVQDPGDRLVQYVVEQGGMIRVLRAAVVQPAPFLDLRQQVTAGGEQGLLGLAFAPDYATSGRFYVDFTDLASNIVVARFRRAAGVPLVADPASRFDLRWGGPGGAASIVHPFSNHNGGNLAFGPDGYLYVGTGDGGSGNDPQNHARIRISEGIAFHRTIRSPAAPPCARRSGRSVFATRGVSASTTRCTAEPVRW